MKKVFYTKLSFFDETNFTTLGSIKEIKLLFVGSQISFVHDNSLRDLLRFDPVVIYEKSNLSPKPVDMSSYDNLLLECDVAYGMIFECKPAGIIHNFTMTIAPGFKYVEGFSGIIRWFMMETIGFFSNISIKLKNGNVDLVSFRGES